MGSIAAVKEKNIPKSTKLSIVAYYKRCGILIWFGNSTRLYFLPFYPYPELKRMQLPKEAIHEFKVIYREEFGEEITDDEAYDRALGVLQLFAILSQKDEEGGRVVPDTSSVRI